MRRESRREKVGKENWKNILYLSGSVLGLAIIAFVITFVVYGNKLEKEAQMSKLDAEKIVGLVPNTIENIETEQASTSMGKKVEESQKETQNTQTNKVINATSQQQDVDKKEQSKQETEQKNENTKTEKETTKQEQPKETKKELSFSMPVEGEVSKEYAKDNLLFSNTLQEWVTHLGIDIKADKTTVVKAAEAGTVKAIKNDPRYGLTIVLEHDNGFETIYSNLLTTEFVTEQEQVKKGQSIGTVGNTATFEIADDTHLHFEIVKDNENVDPTIYLK